jgi:hypothetical protein
MNPDMNTTVKYLLIILGASLLFMPFLGQVHLFDWDEINFAECAREMIVSKDYLRVQIDFMPFWEKPPLFIWMQVLSMKLFGINEYAARFPNAFIGVLTLVSIFHVGRRVINERMATWWVLLYAATWLPHFYFKSGIIDPTFNLLIFLAFFQLYLLKHGTRQILHAILAGLFLGLAVLTKGPVAILVAALSFVVYLAINRGFTGYKTKHLLLIIAAAFVTTAIWFGIEIINHGPKLVFDFIAYQVRLFKTEDAGHGGPFVYHFIVLLIGCFPASAFLFQYYKSRKKKDIDEDKRDFTRWMSILFWVVLILFSIVKTKIVHYSSLCYFPLTYLAAYQVHRLAERQTKLKMPVKVVFLLTGSLFALLIAAMPIIGIHKAKLIPYINDPFAVGNLQANVPWSYAECFWGVLYLISIWAAVILFKKSFRKTMIAFCLVQLVIIQVTVLHFTPKIEAYSQRAAIEYFKSFRGKDVYVQVLDYKSYAHLFYTQKQPPANPDYYNENWLLTGQVDKPTYFICKITEAARYIAMPQLEQIGQKNGFVFFKRR